MASNGHITTEPFPGRGDDAPNGCIVQGFKITTQKLPILKAAPIEAMTDKLGIAVPEMIFGDNYVAIEHAATGWSINFNSYDALDRVDKTGASMLQVAHSQEWKASREHHDEEIKEVIKPFDWSYSTDYRGTITPGVSASFEPTEKQIPIELLKRPDPIKFFDNVDLYEDELADNGISIMSTKVRVMPERMLLLNRFFMRLDGVMFRIRDTRVFVEFRTGEVIREYTAREEKYETVRYQLASRGADFLAVGREPDRLAELLPVADRTCERVVLT